MGWADGNPVTELVKVTVVSLEDNYKTIIKETHFLLKSSDLVTQIQDEADLSLSLGGLGLSGLAQNSCQREGKRAEEGPCWVSEAPAHLLPSPVGAMTGGLQFSVLTAAVLRWSKGSTFPCLGAALA